MSYVKFFFGFCASLYYLTFSKNLMVIRPAVPEILGGAFHPQMLSSCQNEQMLLTVNGGIICYIKITWWDSSKKLLIYSKLISLTFHLPMQLYKQLSILTQWAHDESTTNLRCRSLVVVLCPFVAVSSQWRRRYVEMLHPYGVTARRI